LTATRNRVSLAPPRAGRTTFLRQVGRPSRSIASTTPLRSAIQYKPECCLRVPVPGLRSFLAPNPARSHQGSPFTPRRTTGAESCAQGALSVPPCGRLARCLLSSAPFKSPHSPTASHHALRQIPTGARCSIRPVRGSYLADLAPGGFNTAPSQRAGRPALKPLRSALSWNLLKKARFHAKATLRGLRSLY